MSSSKGSYSRTRPQRHQNRTAFKNDLHDKSNKIKFLNSLTVDGVCKRCKDIIEWKIKYKKYKVLNAPTKCVNCSQKTVKFAYHVLCAPCKEKKNVCAKCLVPNECIDDDVSSNNDVQLNNEITALLNTVPERKRRTIIRLLDKHNSGDNTKHSKENISEKLLQIKALLESLNNTKLEDDSDSESLSSGTDILCQ